MDEAICIIDRFEGENLRWAVIEYDGKLTFNIPRELLPGTAKEGDVLDMTIKVNTEATNSRSEAADALFKNHFEEE